MELTKALLPDLVKLWENYTDLKKRTAVLTAGDFYANETQVLLSQAFSQTLHALTYKGNRLSTSRCRELTTQWYLGTLQASECVLKVIAELGGNELFDIEDGEGSSYRFSRPVKASPDTCPDPREFGDIKSLVSFIVDEPMHWDKIPDIGDGKFSISWRLEGVVPFTGELIRAWLVAALAKTGGGLSFIEYATDGLVIIRVYYNTNWYLNAPQKIPTVPPNYTPRGVYQTLLESAAKSVPDDGSFPQFYGGVHFLVTSLSERTWNKLMHHNTRFSIIGERTGKLELPITEEGEVPIFQVIGTEKEFLDRLPYLTGFIMDMSEAHPGEWWIFSSNEADAAVLREATSYIVK
jgi:hypothetical protein